MSVIYVLGAGFSRTCGIATDIEMLDTLRPLLKSSATKGGTRRTAIDHFLEQSFWHRPRPVGFEAFMSNLTAQKFLSSSLSRGTNIFRNSEREIKRALVAYLEQAVSAIDWDDTGAKAIIDFVRRLDWHKDYVLTFNYDLLLEAAAEWSGIDMGGRVIHLHGAIGEKNLAWPTYTKFAYRTTKMPLGPRWKQAFEVLRAHRSLEKVVFIGYSMPPTDLEAQGIFNYTDWYNRSADYGIEVVNPHPIESNYEFLRRAPVFRCMTLVEWLGAEPLGRSGRRAVGADESA